MSDSANADAPFRIVWSGPARRRLERLPVRAIGSIADLVYGRLADNPRRAGHPLELEPEGRWSARRHPDRVIYTIDDDTRTVTIRDVGHRRDVYRSR